MRRLALCALPLLWALLPLRGGASDEGALAARLGAALDASGLRGARVGALVVSREEGRVLFAHHPDRALVPASNLKILTAIAALSTFGSTHRFTTNVYADALPDAEGGVGNLYVLGGGDPALTSEEFWRLAADLRRRGLTRIRGDLVLDDTRFDAERWHPAWGPLSQRAYHAPVSAFTANYGSFAVSLEPGAARGDPLRVAVDPPVPFFQLVNRGVTGPPRGRVSVVVRRSPARGAEQVTVSGALPVGGDPVTHWRSVGDPTAYAGAVLRLQLEANGITLDGVARSAPVPESAVGLLAFHGRPVAEIVRSFLKYSTNSIGEGLVKAMAARAGERPATWAGGMAAVRAALLAVGIADEGLTLVDGSGLAYGNRATARLLVEALQRADASFAFGPEFEAGLPIAGADGTLEKRAGDAAHAVRAKTGLLTRVTALSGYAALSDGSGAVFSIVVNGYRSGAQSAMDAVDAFVAALVE